MRSSATPIGSTTELPSCMLVPVPLGDRFISTGGREGISRIQHVHGLPWIRFALPPLVFVVAGEQLVLPGL